jgi:hypothetical protein
MQQFPYIQRPGLRTVSIPAISRRRFLIFACGLVPAACLAIHSEAQTLGPLTVNGVGYDSLWIANSYAFQDLGAGRYRFQVRNGDHPYATPTRNRSELLSKTMIPYGQEHWVSFSRKIIDYPNATPEAIFGQIHTPGGRKGPPLVFRVNEHQKLAIQIHYKLPSRRKKVTDLWEGGHPQLGAWEQYVARFRQGDFDGVAQVWRNGIQIVNYTGPLGYPEIRRATRFQFGVYSAEVPGNLSPDATVRTVEFANIRNGPSSLVQYATSPEPVPE